MYFVRQLRFDGPFTDDPSLVRHLADDDGPVRLDLTEGKAEIPWIGDDLHGRVGEHPASDVCTAFEQVARSRRDRHAIPVVGAPTELMEDRPDIHGGVSDPATEDELRVLPEEVDDP